MARIVSVELTDATRERVDEAVRDTASPSGAIIWVKPSAAIIWVKPD
jgi:hypothetical protein